METEENKSKSNLLNSKNGFNTRVNLYIIRYLYYHMKKADQFMQEGQGRRKISRDIQEYINISRQRFLRIFKGSNFSMDVRTAEAIAELFNISTVYFQKNAELIKIHGITQEDWKAFFSMKYPDSTKMNKENGADMKSKEEKVEEHLKELLKNNYVNSQYDTGAAIYRIHYYFERGVTFKTATTLNNFLESLELLKISDWRELAGSPDKLRKYRLLLKKHYEYIDAYIKCRKFEKNM